ncbi:MAG: hypothetical protein ACK5OG_10475, partial [Sphingomonadaceae bacterium]
VHPPSRFEGILISARRQAQDLVGLSPSLPTRQWTKWVKSEGRQNGFDLPSKRVNKNGPQKKLGAMA